MSLDPTQAVAMRDQLLQKLANEHTATCRVIEHVPDDQKLTYKPHADIRTFAELAHHIYATGGWFASIMESGQVAFGGDKPTIPSRKAALLDACNAMNEDLIGRAKRLSAEQLSTDIPFANFGSFPAVSYLDWHISHLIHHRGQLTTYLRTMGAKVPAIYGDSIDYPM